MASNIAIIEIISLNATLSYNLRTLNREAQDRDVYAPMDVNTAINYEGMFGMAEVRSKLLLRLLSVMLDLFYIFFLHIFVHCFF